MTMEVDGADRPALLGRVPLFVVATAAELEAIAALGCEIEVDEGRTIAYRGTVAEDLMVVLEGRAVAIRESGSCSEVGPGDVIGAAGLVDGSVEAATVEATTTLRLFVVSHRRLATVHWRRP
jgi:CRP-like cAMP-binding protein